jgi:hypothetical protein
MPWSRFRDGETPPNFVDNIEQKESQKVPNVPSGSLLKSKHFGFSSFLQNLGATKPAKQT